MRSCMSYYIAALNASAQIVAWTRTSINLHHVVHNAIYGFAMPFARS